MLCDSIYNMKSCAEQTSSEDRSRSVVSRDIGMQGRGVATNGNESALWFCFAFSCGLGWPQTHYVVEDTALNFWPSCLHSQVLALQACIPGLLGTRKRTQNFVHGKQALYKWSQTASSGTSYPLGVTAAFLNCTTLLVDTGKKKSA